MPRKLNPLVSIICAVYNDCDTFEEHMKYLVGQDYKNKEIIIVDDGSTDKTSGIGKRFAMKYKFVKYYRIKHIDGYGCVRPRLEGIKHAKGSVLCFVDADGYYEIDNISLGIKKLFGNNNVAAVVPRMHAWNPHNFIAKYRAMVYETRFNRPEIINKGASEGKYSPWMIKRQVYEFVGGYNINDTYCEDLKLAKKVLDKGYKIIHEPKCNWYHKLGETPSRVVIKNFNIGRMHGSERSFSRSNLLKVGYFSLFFVVIFFGFFNYYFFLLLLLHALPMFINGFRIFIRVVHSSLRWASFYAPLVAYLVNMPYVIGLFFGLANPYKK